MEWFHSSLVEGQNNSNVLVWEMKCLVTQKHDIVPSLLGCHENTLATCIIAVQLRNSLLSHKLLMAMIYLLKAEPSDVIMYFLRVSKIMLNKFFSTA